MNYFLLFVFLSWISVMPHSSDAQEWDRELYFPDYYFYAERRLVNHTIKTMSVKSLDDCEYLCYMEGACVSLNIKNKDPVSGTHECELNNSTHMEHDGDLVDSPIYYYRGAKNNCVKNGWPLCQNNATCQSGFTYKKYRCSCTAGFTGEHCEHDINECVKGSHKCHVNDICINTKGSYNCSCKGGYSGDGHNCTDIDECATGKHNCNDRNNLVCNNTDGSFICRCADGYVSHDNGFCKVDVCHGYKVLNSTDRKNTFQSTQNKKCDNEEYFIQGWYRFMGDAETKMPTYCVPFNRCGGNFPGWLRGSHPSMADGEVGMDLCFRKILNCCDQSGSRNKVKVKNCGSYYVYELFPVLSCNRRYCGAD